ADTATIAAGHWIMELRKADAPVPDSHHYLDEFCRMEYEEWAGQWLFQDLGNADRFDGPEKHREEIKRLIDKAKRAGGDAKPRPPRSYYAVLLMDGDGMGDPFRVAGPAEISRLASALHECCLQPAPRL